MAPSGDLGEGENSPRARTPHETPRALVGDRVTIVVRSFRGPRAGVITEAYRCAGRLVFVVALSPTRRVWLHREDVALARPLEDTPTGHLGTGTPHRSERGLMPKRQCKAIAKRSGKQCTKSAIRGARCASPTGRRSPGQGCCCPRLGGR